MNHSFKNFETLTITGSFTYGNNYQFTKGINLPFQPDEIILKNISVYDHDDTTFNTNRIKMFHIKTNLISQNNSILASYPVMNYSYHESYYLPFKNNSFIRGTYQFNILNAINNTLPVQGDKFNQTIVLTLLFVKY
eukprot:Lithocolla_globosa_v1_NODE_7243_length_972_cov_875.917121.p1 type:complete len:136 gc:universal NODE_7243_length_972_cov_875.917121:617-210(-)